VASLKVTLDRRSYERCMTISPAAVVNARREVVQRIECRLMAVERAHRRAASRTVPDVVLADDIEKPSANLAARPSAAELASVAAPAPTLLKEVGGKPPRRS